MGGCVPRRYRMDQRAAAVEQTRQRIVDAAMALHAAQGIVGTSYEEIADRAGTAPATVYRHFPSLGHLLPACARSIQVLRPVTPEHAAETFAHLHRPEQRLQVLVRGTCDCYARDEGWLTAARGEEGLVPALREIARTQRENLHRLVEAALADTDAGEDVMRVVAALLDFPVWKSLREAGLDEGEAADQILDLVRHRLAREGMF